MKFRLKVLDRKTGAPLAMEVVADDEEAAIREAGEKGFVVESVRPIETLSYATWASDLPTPVEPMPVAAVESRARDGPYKVVWFHPSLDPLRGDGRNPAEQLQTLINTEATAGWVYVRLEAVATPLLMSETIFGMPSPGRAASTQYLAVFRRRETVADSTA